MIVPITKEYFWKKVGKVNSWRKIHKFNLKAVTEHHEDEFLLSNIWYFEKTDGSGMFAYLNDRLLIIPENYPDLSVSEKEKIDFSRWHCEVLGGHDTRYTNNVYSRTKSYMSIGDPAMEIFKKYPENTKIRVYNKDVGYSKEIELRYEEKYWNNIDVVYEEKLKLPFNITKTSEEDAEIINILLWSNGVR